MVTELVVSYDYSGTNRESKIKIKQSFSQKRVSSNEFRINSNSLLYHFLEERLYRCCFFKTFIRTLSIGLLNEECWNAKRRVVNVYLKNQKANLHTFTVFMPIFFVSVFC